MRKNTYKIVKKLKVLRALLLGKKKMRLPFTFEVHIIDSCNLNCKGCFHFSSLQENSPSAIYDIEEYKRDMVRMGGLFADNTAWIHVMGGEPLLNERAEEYLEITKQAFPNTEISFITNGLLLNSNVAIIDYCAKNGICISVTKYPISFDYEGLEKLLSEHGCKYEFFGDRSGDTGMKNTSLDPENQKSFKRNFLRCNLSNVCITLDRGKLFYCSVPAYVRIFNEKMGADYKWDTDYINIYRNDKEEILEFLRTPHRFCGYCDILYRKNNCCPWEVTKKNRSEWEISSHV